MYQTMSKMNSVANDNNPLDRQLSDLGIPNISGINPMSQINDRR